MPPKKAKHRDDELEMVIKITSLTGASLAFAGAILGVCAIVLAWWVGTNSSQLLKVGLDGTETTVKASISLWDFDLRLRLAPEQGELEGREYDLRTTWDDMCSTALKTTREPGECINVRIARAFTILNMLLSSFSAFFVVLSRRFTPLLLLGGILCSTLATLCALGGLGIGVLTSASGLTGWGFLMLGGSMLMCAASVTALFYAAAKAMPGASAFKDESRGSRLKRIQEAKAKNMEMASALEAGVRKKKEKTEGQEEAKKIPVMLKKVIYWGQEHEDEEEGLPIELLQAAYQEIDDDGSGTVTLEELVDSLKDCGLPASQEAADAVMMEIDKNMDGTIDIHEFVEFFKTLEEMDKFQKKTEQRAAFLSCICNFCFLAMIVIVGTMLMLFIGMDKDENPDNYAIMQNLLVAFSVTLFVLFMFVIAIPAGRMTLGPQIAAWQFHYHKSMQNRGKQAQKAQSHQMTGGSLRNAAWTEGGGIGPPPVNAAKYGASYRVSKMTYDMSAEMNQIQDYPQQGQRSLTAASEQQREATGSSGRPGTGPPQVAGAILSKTGDFVRYDPAAFQRAAMTSTMARMPMSFTPMQVQNLGTSSDMPDHPEGMMAITDDGYG